MIVEEWFDNSGRLSISWDQVPSTQHELGKLYEKICEEVLRQEGFIQVRFVDSFYDFEAFKEGDHYHIEVKGRLSPRTPYTSSQLPKLQELKDSGKKVYWIFVQLGRRESRNPTFTYSLEPF